MSENQYEDGANNNYSNKDRASSDSSIYENEVPLVGYVLSSNNAQLKVFSVKNDKTKHILRFGSPIIKF